MLKKGRFLWEILIKLQRKVSIFSFTIFSLGSLKDYFSQFGEVDKAFVIYHHKTGESRGFGFVEFVNKNSVSEVLRNRSNLFLDDYELDCESVVLKGESFQPVNFFFVFFNF